MTVMHISGRATPFIVFLLISSMLSFGTHPVRSSSAELIVPDQYSTIQAAINAANAGDTIFVKSGAYYEHVIVNRTVAIVGENRDTTIIDGSYSGIVVNIMQDGVNISSFTIQRSGTTWNIGGPPYGAGIYMGNVTDCIICGNKFTQDAAGIQLEFGADENVIINNTMTSVGLGFGTFNASWNSFTGNNVTSTGRGLGLNVNSDYNIISDNRITASEWVIALHACHYNNITDNYIANGQIGIYLPDSSYTRVYHNNVVNNVQQASMQGFPSHVNYWDDGYPSGGNYWKDYTGSDADRDGLGDTPYVVDINNIDHYPLYPLWSTADVNHDLKVDILDVVRITGIYGMTSSNPGWDPYADIAQPYGKIDILDVVICTSHYGEKYLG
jgi:parallel beta-helix repeat protein